VLQHIRFAPVNNLEQVTSCLEGKGFKVKYSGNYAGSSFAYFESPKAKGLILEFVEHHTIN